MDTGAGAIWVTKFNGTVMRVDPGSDDIVARIRTGPRPLGVHASAGAVWVVDDVAGTLTRIDPATNDVVAKVRTGANLARGVAADRSAAWAVGCVARDGSGDPRVDHRDCDWSVLVVDARTNELSLTIPLFVEGRQVGPPAPTSGGWPFDVLAVGEGGVWAVPYTPACGTSSACPDQFLLRIDRESGAAATMEVGTGTIDAAVSAGDVWVVVRDAGELVRIDLNA
jgi:DNA-binding beta-propeller fold protein YncE